VDTRREAAAHPRSITAASCDTPGPRLRRVSTFPRHVEQPTKVHLNTTGGWALQNGVEYGGRTAIVAHFDEPLPNRAAAERVLLVDTSPAVYGYCF
jgi:hypothetical protein